MQLSWYSDFRGPSFLRTTEPITVETPDQWQAFRFDVQAPPGAAGLGVFLRLVPPLQGVSAADFDNIHIIEWAPAHAKYSPFYDQALLTGTGALTFRQQIFPGAEPWLTEPVADLVR
jgi:hypothetical protein